MQDLGIIIVLAIMFFSGCLAGVGCYEIVLQKRAESGVLKIGTKFYEVKLLTFRKRN